MPRPQHPALQLLLLPLLCLQPHFVCNVLHCPACTCCSQSHLLDTPECREPSILMQQLQQTLAMMEDIGTTASRQEGQEDAAEQGGDHGGQGQGEGAAAGSKHADGLMARVCQLLLGIAGAWQSFARLWRLLRERAAAGQLPSSTGGGGAGGAAPQAACPRSAAEVAEAARNLAKGTSLSALAQLEQEVCDFFGMGTWQDLGQGPSLLAALQADPLIRGAVLGSAGIDGTGVAGRGLDEVLELMHSVAGGWAEGARW